VSKVVFPKTKLTQAALLGKLKLHDRIVSWLSGILSLIFFVLPLMRNENPDKKFLHVSTFQLFNTSTLKEICSWASDHFGLGIIQSILASHQERNSSQLSKLPERTFSPVSSFFSSSGI
jgi:hypothetical protein